MRKRKSGFARRVVKHAAAVWDYRRQGQRPRHPASIYKIFCIRERTGSDPRPSVDAAELAFSARQALPALCGGRITHTQIHKNVRARGAARSAHGLQLTERTRRGFASLRKFSSGGREKRAASR